MPVNNDTFTANPFTLVFDALWSMLESSPVFVADVAVKNRIHYNLPDNRNPYKQQVNDSDLPEVILIPVGATVNLFNNSSSTKVIKRYSWLISTGDVRVNNYLHQIEWDLLLGMTGWQKLLGALQWNGNGFVKRADIIDVNEGLSDQERNRGIKGWSTVWSCEVEMYFKSQDLIDARGY